MNAMNGLCNFLVSASFACAALTVSGPDVQAQGTAVAGYPATTSSLNGGGMGMGTGMGMGLGMGMGYLPMMYAMNPTASLSPTDAAALGAQGQGTGSFGANGMNSMFRNPMASPLLYSGLYPMGGNQAAALMLANQAGMLGGIGSGQLSGVRPVNAQSRGRSGQQSAAKPRGTASQPGGLATRYFNRTATINRYPQSYYKRANRYYPQVAR
jgi:hypothetical protein